MTDAVHFLYARGANKNVLENKAMSLSNSLAVDEHAGVLHDDATQLAVREVLPALHLMDE
jgi:hypothetical protein